MTPETPMDVEGMRQSRKILPFLTDYSSDEISFPDRAGYYRMLKNDLGISTIRTEFRMNRMIGPDRIFQKDVVAAYKDSLVAMKEAGLTEPIIALFTPDKWMVEEAQKSPESFAGLYRNYVEKVKSLCEETGVTPSYIQVMNEANWSAQTPFSLDQMVDMMKTTKDIFGAGGEQAKTKIMTTIYANSTYNLGSFRETRLGKLVKRFQFMKVLPPWNDWQEYTEELLKKGGDSVDAIGFDFYPGSWDTPAIPSRPAKTQDTIKVDGKTVHRPVTQLLNSRAFRSFGVTAPYKWIVREKMDGVLKDKDILLTEIGVPGLSNDSKFARYGLNRIVQTLDHFLLQYERKGYKAQDIIKAIGFFEGGNHPSIDSKMVGKLDLTPWTLLRQGKDGGWEMTSAGQRIKHLIDTRINPTK